MTEADDLLDLWGDPPTTQQVLDMAARERQLELDRREAAEILRLDALLRTYERPAPTWNLFGPIAAELHGKVAMVEGDTLFDLEDLPDYGTSIGEAYDRAQTTFLNRFHRAPNQAFYFGYASCLQWRMLDAPYAHISEGCYERMVVLFQGESTEAGALDF